MFHHSNSKLNNECVYICSYVYIHICLCVTTINGKKGCEFQKEQRELHEGFLG